MKEVILIKTEPTIMAQCGLHQAQHQGQSPLGHKLQRGDGNTSELRTDKVGGRSNDNYLVCSSTPQYILIKTLKYTRGARGLVTRNARYSSRGRWRQQRQGDKSRSHLWVLTLPRRAGVCVSEKISGTGQTWRKAIIKGRLG